MRWRQAPKETHMITKQFRDFNDVNPWYVEMRTTWEADGWTLDRSSGFMQWKDDTDLWEASLVFTRYTET